MQHVARKIVIGRKFFSAAFCSAANANNRGTNTVVSAAAGVLIGNSVNGQIGAVVGTVLGTVAGASINGDGQGHGAQGGYAQPAHTGEHSYPKQANYQPAVTCYQPSPAYFQPTSACYQPATTYD